MHPQVGGPGWRHWLASSACASDCRLASYATKALLNLEALDARWVGSHVHNL